MLFRRLPGQWLAALLVTLSVLTAAPAWAEAQRRMAAGRLSCLARNGQSPGEESLTDAVAVQAIEA